MRKLFALTALLFFQTYSVSAAPERLGQFGDWLAYMDTDGGQKVCYMASMPKKDEGNYKKRGDIYAVVAHRPAEKSFDVFNLVAGYTYKKGAKVTVTISKQTFSNFYTDKDAAWTLTDKDDKALVLAMKKGESMVVKGVSSRGTQTKDTFSLKGFTKAYQAISQKCGKK